MQSVLCLLVAATCVAFAGALPLVGKAVETKALDHIIQKRQLEGLSQHLCGIGVPYLEGLLVDLDVPAYSTGSLSVYDIDVTAIDINECAANISAALKPIFRMTLSNISVSITGKFDYTWGWFLFSGNWDLELRNGYLHVSATVDLDLSTGVPQVSQLTVIHCDDDFPLESAYFYGSLSAWIINLFREPISRTLDNILENKVCELGTPYLESQLFG